MRGKNCPQPNSDRQLRRRHAAQRHSYTERGAAAARIRRAGRWARRSRRGNDLFDLRFQPIQIKILELVQLLLQLVDLPHTHGTLSHRVRRVARRDQTRRTGLETAMGALCRNPAPRRPTGARYLRGVSAYLVVLLAHTHAVYFKQR